MDLIRVATAISALLLPRGQLKFSLLSPDVVEWEYAKAVAARRAGDKPAAFTALGACSAIHDIPALDPD